MSRINSTSPRGSESVEAIMGAVKPFRAMSSARSRTGIKGSIGVSLRLIVGRV